MRKLTVDLGERSYPILIGQGISEQITRHLSDRGILPSSPLLIVTDDNVASFHLQKLKAALEAGGYRTCDFIVSAGETSKSLAMLEEIIRVALEAGLDRNSVIVALGGGVVGDLAGFAAASYMRGIRFVQVPTTILAHDSSVGGKVAVNHRLAKNVIGAFHQPELVLYDTALLQTLPPRDVRAGFAEVIKEGLILDKEYVEWFSDHLDALLALDPPTLEKALFEACRIKAEVVSQDERENGLREILNLGHTIGHALEAVAGYGTLLHGEAISIGMVGAAQLSEEFGRSQSITDTTRDLLKRIGCPVTIPRELDTDAIMEALMHDKKFREGKLTFILPLDIGRVEINKQVTKEQVRRIVDGLKQEE
ncbi:3-dehydroquinate synthase [Gorillibacterium timonense]|uniref:3-dehydroquinate synthase n=1 Tax=Gorillibacterium timonense TaxID=1689269 RepID=UPI00071D69A8|nr:3-dehydroquinate synthase [Gorillibacterium timonense]